MVCRSCGATVGDSDRFCNSCGARLAAGAPLLADEPPPDENAATTESEVIASPGPPPSPGPPASPPSPAADSLQEPALPPPVETPSDDVTTAQTAVPPSPPTGAGAMGPPTDDVTTVQSAVPPPPATGDSTAETGGDDRDATSEMPAPSLYDLADEPDFDVTSQLAAMASGRAAAASQPAPATTGQTATTATTPAAEATTTMGTVGSTTTGQVPASYTPYTAPAERSVEHLDRYDRYEPRPHRFRFRVMLIVAILAAGAGACAAVTDVITIETDAANPLFPIGTWMVNDFGTNNTVAMAIAAGAMVIGALVGCFGYRWGGGLAGGAGLAMAGWAALTIGLAEIPLAQADTALQAQQTESFRVTLTRDLGYGLVAVAGALGVVVFLTSLGSIRRDRATNLNPWVAALGAAATLVAAAGPLLPVNDASIENNWSSAGGSIDFPTLFFAGRLVQVGLVAFTGLVGFLLVRRYGLGLAAGGFTVFTWLALTALLEQTDLPIGPAVANPGADLGDTIPHAVTIGGLAVALFCLVMAAIEVALSGRPDE
jgi:MFS family permease